jgi:hypothetical protein
MHEAFQSTGSGGAGRRDGAVDEIIGETEREIEAIVNSLIVDS